MSTAKKISFEELKSKITPAATAAILAHFSLMERFSREADGSLRGPCPFACERADGRSFKITADGRAWFSHDRACQCLPISEATGQRVRGGNMLDFIRYKTGGSIRDAGLLLDSLLGSPPPKSATPKEVAPLPKAETSAVSRNATFAERGYKPLQLDPEAECIVQLGLEPELLATSNAGYTEKGLMKGRLAFPIHNGAGELVAYGGFKVKKDVEGPVWLYPKDFNPELELVGFASAKDTASIAVTFDLLEAAYARQALDAGHGVVCILSSTLSAPQKAMLAELTAPETVFLVFAAPSEKSQSSRSLAEEAVLYLSTLAPTRFKLAG